MLDFPFSIINFQFRLARVRYGLRRVRPPAGDFLLRDRKYPKSAPGEGFRTPSPGPTPERPGGFGPLGNPRGWEPGATVQVNNKKLHKIFFCYLLTFFWESILYGWDELRLIR